MKIREVERLLRNNDFYLLRKGKHAIWTNGVKRVTIPMGNKCHDKLFCVIKNQILKNTDNINPNIRRDRVAV